MISSLVTKVFGQLVGDHDSGSGPFHAYAIACAADLYVVDTTLPNPNGALLDGSAFLSRYAGQATADYETRPLYLMAESQFLYQGVRLFGKFLGDATVDYETRPVFGVAPCHHCLWTADYFNRDDAADAGESWIEVAGSASIAGGKLVIAADDALIIHRFPLPNYDPFPDLGSVAVTIESVTVGNQAKVIGSRKDASNYVYALWEFAAGEGLLSMYRVVGGTPALERGPYAFPGQGAGQATRLRLCWSNSVNGLDTPKWNVEVETIDSIWSGLSSPLTSSFPSYDLTGRGHGLGTGDVAGGQVGFDDYQVFRDTDQKPTANCPDCRVCHACPDDQELCLEIRGTYGEERVLIMHRRTGYIWPGTWGGYEVCDWGTDDFAGFVAGVVQGGDDAFAAVLYQQDNGHWVLAVFSDGNYWVYLFDLGELPDCSQFLCLRLRVWETIFLPLGLPQTELTPELFDYFALAPAAISSGPYCPDCYLPRDFDCCDDAELPGTLYVTYSINGTPVMSDEPFDGGQDPFGVPNTFEYLGSGEFGSVGFRCNEGEHAIFVDPLNDVVFEFGIESCEPFHGVATYTSGGNTYELEIIE